MRYEERHHARFFRLFSMILFIIAFGSWVVRPAVGRSSSLVVGVTVVGLQGTNAIFLECSEGLRERETGRGDDDDDDAASRKRCVHGGDVVCTRGMRRVDANGLEMFKLIRSLSHYSWRKNRKDTRFDFGLQTGVIICR